jgi:hypothetical protein
MHPKNSNINIGEGTLYFIKQNGEKVEVSVCEALEPINWTEDEMSVPLKFINEPTEVTFTCKLSFRSRVKLFGFWRTVKSLFRRKRNE